MIETPDDFTFLLPTQTAQYRTFYWSDSALKWLFESPTHHYKLFIRKYGKWEFLNHYEDKVVAESNAERETIDQKASVVVIECKVVFHPPPKLPVAKVVAW